MWFLLAVLAAATQVARNLFMKRIGHALDETINVWGRFTFILPFALAIMMIRGIPTVQPGFWPVALAFTGVQLAATLSLSKALKVAEISLVTALWKLSIVLLVFWGFVTLGEQPPPLGLVGVCLSVAGVYLVNVRRARKNPWAPLLALVQEPGQRWTLVACMFYAPTVALSKQMAMLSDV
ncbi:MAG: DMT family transporter, partial [Deltaproteobacteria bacterium]|nr:DMT family transporter [Deltaproteobacteria bacterium]